MVKPTALGLASLLYGAILLGANPAKTEGLSVADRQILMDLREGDLGKLVFHDEVRPRIEEGWRDQYGNAIETSDYEGKVVLLNFWATWCPPCRAEMPGIDRLAGEMEGGDFEVIALSTDRFDVERVAAFFEEIEAQNLEVHQDRRGLVARRAGVLGLPVTVLLDRQGREVARMTGEAEWDSPRAKEILSRLIEMTAPGS